MKHLPQHMKLLIICGITILAILGILLGSTWHFFLSDRSDDTAYISFDIAHSGNTMVFTGKGKGGLDLYLLNLATWKVTRLTDTSDVELGPAFTPDGQTVLYSETQSPQLGGKLMSYSLSSGKKRPLTPSPTTYNDQAPSCSQNGHRIAFARASRHRPYSLGGMKWDDWDIYTMKVDGSDVKRVTSNHFYSVSGPVYAMEDHAILFTGITHGNQGVDACLYSVSADGKSRPSILDTARSSAPTIAPDGKHLAIISDRTKQFAYDILTMQPDGKNAHSLSITRSSRYNAHPVFSGDGKRIFFLGDPEVDNLPKFRLYSVTLGSETVTEEASHELFETPLKWERAATH